MRRIDGPTLAALDALGLLVEAERVELEAALSRSEDLRHELHELYEIAAALPRALPPDMPSPAVRERILSVSGVSRRSAQGEGGSEGLHFVTRDEGWRPHPIPGIAVKVLSIDATTGVATLLIKAAPGTTYPAHHHSGPEGCYVIEGEILVAGRRIGPGDFHLADAGSDHDPLYTETGATVLLVCAAADYL
jgi:quercetin dioxygenase-like cupin family protein